MGSLICYTAELMEPQTLVITGVRDQARATRSFDLRAGGAVYFTPGQVAVLRVEGEEPAYFAFAGAPEDRDLEVLVKQKAGASAVIYNKCVGDQIELVGIAGHGFNLDAMKGRDLVFVAMGTGVAPLRSALRHVLKRKEEFGQLVVLYKDSPEEIQWNDPLEMNKRTFVIRYFEGDGRINLLNVLDSRSDTQIEFMEGWRLDAPLGWLRTSINGLNMLIDGIDITLQPIPQGTLEVA